MLNVRLAHRADCAACPNLAAIAELLFGPVIGVTRGVMAQAGPKCA